MWETLFFCIGLLHVAYFCKSLVEILRRHFSGKAKDLNRRYGKKSWALVTGASRGIGKEYCMQLAQAGFNICLVSRTRSKLEEVEKKI